MTPIRSTAVLLSFVLVASSAVRQAESLTSGEVPAQAPPEPEFAETFFRLSGESLVPLERQVSAIQGRASGFIVLTMKGVAHIPGGKSPIRFEAEQPLDFVVRSAILDKDPGTLYCLRKLDSKSGGREVPITVGHATPLGARVDSSLSRGTFPVTIAKYGSSSYKLSTPGLQPGEYSVGRFDARVLFCFGVNRSDSGSSGAVVRPEQCLMTVTVNSQPSDAFVEVDGYPAGKTPVDVKLAKGDYTLKISKIGFGGWTQKLTVEAGKAQSLGIALAPTAVPTTPGLSGRPQPAITSPSAVPPPSAKSAK